MLMHTGTHAIANPTTERERVLCPSCVENHLTPYRIAMPLGLRLAPVGTAFVAVCKTEDGRPGCGFSVKLDTDNP